MSTLRIEPINMPAKRCGEYSLIDERGREIAVVTGKVWATKLGAVDDLLKAVGGLLPRRWRDGTMDHMPGVKAGAIGDRQGEWQMKRSRLSAAEMSLGLSILLAELHAFETIDQLAMYEWARPRLDELRLDFYRSREPSVNFPLWLSTRYLNRKVAA